MEEALILYHKLLKLIQNGEGFGNGMLDATNALAGQIPIADGNGGWAWGYLPGMDPEPEVDEMTEQDIKEAIEKEWSGESSSDPTAMSEEDIQQAISTTWDGGSSSDPSALSKEEIYEAIALAE